MRPLQARADGDARQQVTWLTVRVRSEARRLPAAREVRRTVGPSCVYVHGGGFARGDKRAGENIAAYFAPARLCVGVTIN